MWERTKLDAPDNQLFGVHSERDKTFWKGLETILTEHPHSLQHVLTHWPAYTKRVLITRFLAHYELFKMTTDLPGSIVELGVSRGISFFSFHKFLEVFCPCDTTKKVFGFDSFEGLTDFSDKDGHSTTDSFSDKREGGWSAEDAEAEIFSLAGLYNNDNILAKERCRLIKGRIQDTLPTFLKETPGIRLSLLHFDLDLYEPTRFALENLWDLVVPGGVVVFDEYGLPPWGGEATAFDEFCRGRGLRVSVKKFPWCVTPTGYVVK